MIPPEEQPPRDRTLAMPTVSTPLVPPAPTVPTADEVAALLARYPYAKVGYPVQRNVPAFTLRLPLVDTGEHDPRADVHGYVHEHVPTITRPRPPALPPTGTSRSAADGHDDERGRASTARVSSPTPGDAAGHATAVARPAPSSLGHGPAGDGGTDQGGARAPSEEILALPWSPDPPAVPEVRHGSTSPRGRVTPWSEIKQHPGRLAAIIVVAVPVGALLSTLVGGHPLGLVDRTARPASTVTESPGERTLPGQPYDRYRYLPGTPVPGGPRTPRVPLRNAPPAPVVPAPHGSSQRPPAHQPPSHQTHPPATGHPTQPPTDHPTGHPSHTPPPHTDPPPTTPRPTATATATHPTFHPTATHHSPPPHTAPPTHSNPPPVHTESAPAHTPPPTHTDPPPTASHPEVNPS